MSIAEIAPNLLRDIALGLGAFFVLVGAVGLVRMPDVFTRMHAASVLETVGGGLLLLGMMIEAGISLVLVKLAFILALFFLTAPVVTHALAQAALNGGTKPLLAEDRREAEPGTEGAP